MVLISFKQQTDCAGSPKQVCNTSKVPTVKGAFKGKVWNDPELSREVVEVGSSVLSRYSRLQSQILLELRNSLDFLALTFPTARLESVRRIRQQHLPH